MFATESALRRDSKSWELQVAAEWERAAQCLDIDPLVLERVRRTTLELSSRHTIYVREAATRVSFYLAGTDLSEGRDLFFLEVGPEVSFSETVRNAVELQVLCALTNREEGTGSIGLWVPGLDISERELCRLAHECAALLGRLSNDAQLLPVERPSVAFAQWMAHAGITCSSKLTAPSEHAGMYAGRREIARAHAVMQLCKLALRDKGKQGSGRFSIVGASTFSCSILEEIRRAKGSVVAVADESGGIIDSDGLEIGALLEHFANGGLVAETAQGRHVSRREAIRADADITVIHSSAIELDGESSADLKASIVLDMSGRAISTSGVKALAAQNRGFLPSQLISAAMLIGELSGVERVGAIQKNDDRGPGVEELWISVAEVAAKFGVGLAQATLMLALQRLAHREGMHRV